MSRRPAGHIGAEPRRPGRTVGERSQVAFRHEPPAASAREYGYVTGTRIDG